MISYIDELGTTETIDNIPPSSTSYDIIDLVNGRNYTLNIKAVTSMGASAWSPNAVASPFGNPVITSVNVSGKLVTVDFQPNGRAGGQIHVLALDSDPVSAEVEEMLLHVSIVSPNVAGQLSQQVDFATYLSGDIVKYLVFITNSASGASNIVSSGFAVASP